jgi:hypothetical protein
MGAGSSKKWKQRAPCHVLSHADHACQAVTSGRAAGATVYPFIPCNGAMELTHHKQDYTTERRDAENKW